MEIVDDFVEKIQQQKQALDIVEDFASESQISSFFFFFFSLFFITFFPMFLVFFFSFSFFHFFIFPFFMFVAIFCGHKINFANSKTLVDVATDRRAAFLFILFLPVFFFCTRKETKKKKTNNKY